MIPEIDKELSKKLTEAYINPGLTGEQRKQFDDIMYTLEAGIKNAFQRGMTFAPNERIRVSATIYGETDNNIHDKFSMEVTLPK